MFGGISFGGLGSGLDTGAIIEALLSVERQPIDMLRSRVDAEQSKIDLIGSFEGMVNDLRSKASVLSERSSFVGYTVDASFEGYATFAASSEATPGSHTLEVERLATTDRWAFDAVADPDQDLATVDGSTVSFLYDGTFYDVTVDAAESSLNEIAAAFTEQTDGLIDVSIVNVGTETDPAHQLVIGARDTGEAQRIQAIFSDIDGLNIDGTAPNAAGEAQSVNNITVGNNAVATIDGLRVEREDNSFGDVIQGVSIQVLSETLEPVTFTVGEDREAITERVQEFVDSFNEIANFINSQNTYSEDGGAGGELFGDSLLRSVQTAVRNSLFNQSAQDINQDTEGFGTLRLIGIEQSSDGTLSLDNATLTAKMDQDLEAVLDLFVDSDGVPDTGPDKDSGLAAELVIALDALTEASSDPSGNRVPGLFDLRTETLGDNIKRFDQQIEAREFRLVRYEENLVARYAALENLMAQLNSQQAFLSAELNNSSSA